MKFRKFVDSAKIYVAGGKGGSGCASFRREKYVPRGGPDGGDGGRGGHVYLFADSQQDSLINLYYAPHRRAGNGGPGRGKQMHGKNGEDIRIPVPCGTEVWDMGTGEKIGDLTTEGSEMLVAKGGKGGLGNCHWVSPTHQAPTEFTEGEPGEERTLRLDLKLIADVGLVGFPNAGKSSLITAITRAHPKVAPYPFTTINPIIGTLEFGPYRSIRIADIPGLINGAHAGAGLGDAFLRHIERSSILLFVIDMAGADGRNPADDYRSLREELKLYDPRLLKRQTLIAANKMDLPEAEANLRDFVRKTRRKPIPISAATGSGLDALKTALEKITRSAAPQRQ